MTLESDGKFGEKLVLDFKNDMANLVNFDASSGKSENLYFDGPLLSTAYKVSAKKEFSLVILKCFPNFEENSLFV